jgi:hypothetical protein
MPTVAGRSGKSLAVKSEKGENQVMQIAEMRSALESEYSKRAKFGDQLPAMPTWCVRRIFEKRNGLSVTPLPSGIEVRSLRSIMATAPRKSAVSVPAEPEVTQEDFDARKRRLAFLKAV